MRPYTLLLAALAFVLGVAGVLSYELRNPGAVQTELAVASPRVLTASPAPVVAAATETDVRMARVDLALDVLAKYVTERSHPDALRSAFQAYYNYKAENPSQVRKPYLYYVDYGLDNRTPRGYVFDMEKLSVIEGPFMVAHGRGSGSDGVPTRFSNRNGSAATSLGLYLAQETYSFSGTSSGRRYSSIGLRLRGLSGSYNSAARSRGVVAHGAPYVTATRAGRSEGCPAMEQHRADRLLPMIANGGMVFHFSPEDKNWLAGDPWARRGVGQMAASSPAVDPT